MRRVVLGAAAALVVAGCGGQDKPSREEFVREAEAACAEVERQAERLSGTRPKDVDELVAFAEDVRKTTDDAIARIEDIETPEGDAGETAERWKEAARAEADEANAAIDALKKAAESGDDQALLAAVQDLQRIQADENSGADRLSRELGLKRCADS